MTYTIQESWIFDLCVAALTAWGVMWYLNTYPTNAQVLSGILGLGAGFIAGSLNTGKK